MRLAMLPIMSKLSGLAVRIALVGAATAGAVAACYDRVPGPSGPLPPTKEAKPFGSKPKRVQPAVEVNQKFAADQDTKGKEAKDKETEREKEKERPVPPPTTTISDAGIADVVELPPVPDAAVSLDAPPLTH